MESGRSMRGTWYLGSTAWLFYHRLWIQMLPVSLSGTVKSIFAYVNAVWTRAEHSLHNSWAKRRVKRTFFFFAFKLNEKHLLAKAKHWNIPVVLVSAPKHSAVSLQLWQEELRVAVRGQHIPEAGETWLLHLPQTLHGHWPLCVAHTHTHKYTSQAHTHTHRHIHGVRFFFLRILEFLWYKWSTWNVLIVRFRPSWPTRWPGHDPSQVSNQQTWTALFTWVHG